MSPFSYIFRTITVPAFMALALVVPCKAASKPERVRIIDSVPTTSTYAWWVNGSASVTCSGNTCNAYFVPPSDGVGEVAGAVVRLLRPNGVIVIAECAGKENIAADITADLAGVGHSKVYRDCRIPESGERQIDADFSTAAVKLTFTNPMSDPSGRIFSETYRIKGFLNPVSASNALASSMSFEPEPGNREIACGPNDKRRMKVHTQKDQHPIGTAPTDGALIYVIQQHQMTVKVLGAFPTRIAVDRAWVGSNHSESYFYFPVNAGEHQVCAEWELELRNHVLPSTSAKFFAEAGHTYYLRERVTFIGLDGERSVTLEPMNDKEGAALIASLPYSRQE